MTPNSQPGADILVARNAVAILRDHRLAALFPLAIALGRMGPSVSSVGGGTILM